MEKTELIDFAIDWLEMLKSDYLANGEQEKEDAIKYVI